MGKGSITKKMRQREAQLKKKARIKRLIAERRGPGGRKSSR